MPTPYVALLRAVNVGGTGKLPMAELKAMCEAEGFGQVRTWIASGNVVFTADHTAAQVKAALERRLLDYAGKPVGVLVRTATELAAVLDGNPFPGEPGNRTLAIFLDTAPPADAATSARHLVDERIALGTRELYVAYGDGMGASKLLIPAAASGTARNMNTVARLVAMTAAL